MSRYALWLCMAVALTAPIAQSTETEVLVPEGEPETILEGAQWTNPGSGDSIVFGPDGRTLLSIGSSGTLRLWETVSLRELRRLKLHTDWIQAIAFSPDKRILATGGRTGTVHLWDLKTGKELLSLEGPSDLIRSLAFSADSRIIASGGNDGTVCLWDVATGRELRRITGHSVSVQSLTFSPNRRILASGGGDGAIRLWDLDTGREFQLLKAHSSLVQSLVFSPDGRTLASIGDENTTPQDEREQWSGKIYLWDVDSGRNLRRLEGHSGLVQTIAFSPDGMTLASAGGDSTIRLWETGSGRELHRMKDSPGLVRTVVFSPDGRMLASTGSTLRLWEVVSGQELRHLEKRLGAVTSIAFLPGGRTLVVGGGDGVIRLWSLDNGRVLHHLEDESALNSVRSTALSPDGQTLASSGYGKRIQLWNTYSGEKLDQFSLGTDGGPGESIAFSPDGLNIATGGDGPQDGTGRRNGTVWLWEVATGRELRRLEKLPSLVRSVVFSPISRTVAASGDDGTITLWDVSTGRVQRQMRGDWYWVRAIAFSPNGRILAAGSGNGMVRLWDVERGSELRKFQTRVGQVLSVAFSPNGRTLAVSGEVKAVGLWDVSSGRELRQLQGSFRSSVAFSPDGSILATGGSDSIVRLWSTVDGKLIGKLLGGGQLGWLSHLSGKNILRHDDGRFLHRQHVDGVIEPILPRQPESEPRFSIDASLKTVPEDLGKAGELFLRLTNAQDAGRAYWIRVEPVELPPGLLLFSPTTILRLDAGNSVELPVKLFYLRVTGSPIPQDPKIRIKIVHAFGEGPVVDVPIQIRAPNLTQVGSAHVEDKTLSITIANTGTQSIGPIDFNGVFRVDEKTQPSAKLTYSFEPGQPRTLKFDIEPPFLKAKSFSFDLTANYEKWPRTWTFSAPEVEVPIPYGLYIALSLGAILLFGFVYYARVYRNPMVVHASRSPATLKSYPLAQMVAADHALRRARRLGSTITAAGIPATRWQRALCGARSPQDAALAFAEVVGGKLGASLGSSTWALSLPPLRLRFARDTAVVVIDGTRLESGDAARRMADVFQDGRGPSQVLVLDRTSSQNARQVLEGVPRVRCVVLSDNRLRDLLLADEPVRLLETIISEQVAVSELSPYQVAGGVKLENLFFGREREVRAMADRAMRNFLVVGQRQMGKSSLLLAVLRRLQARPDLDASYVELADAELHRRLARERDRLPAEGAPLPPFVEVAAGTPSRPRVWLIDEADDFISADAKAGYPVLQAMRALAEEGRAYFILAGFWDLYRAVVLDEKQPLRNFGEHLRLEPLDPRSALALVTEPMTALGLWWDAPSTPEVLVEQAGRRANLLVLACKALVESLPPDTHVLTREHLERILREDKDLRDQGRRWRGDHPLHRAVVRQALLLGRPKREEVRQALVARGADIRSADFDEAMDHRELSYVLVPDGEGRLYCPVPLMQRYIESERGLEAGLAEDLEDLRRRGLAEVPKPA